MLENHMNESTKEPKVYEISYILVPSLPAEKVKETLASFKSLLAKSSAAILEEEAPALISLAYEMDKSSGGGSHQRFNEGYFGWIKFECSPSFIEEIRKAFELDPGMLRTMAISTVREKTYLGKRAKSDTKMDEKAPKIAMEASPRAEISTAAVASLSPADIAQVDKSIDEMVKGA
jgi:ribosomal protein S6